MCFQATFSINKTNTTVRLSKLQQWWSFKGRDQAQSWQHGTTAKHKQAYIIKVASTQLLRAINLSGVLVDMAVWPMIHDDKCGRAHT